MVTARRTDEPRIEAADVRAAFDAMRGRATVLDLALWIMAQRGVPLRDAHRSRVSRLVLDMAQRGEVREVARERTDDRVGRPAVVWGVCDG